MIRSRTRSALGVAVLAALPYLPNLAAPLQWDDRNHLLESRFTWDWGNAPKLFIPEQFLAANWPIGPTFRPLADLTFFVDYTLWRHKPPGSRIFNLLAHALCAALLFMLLAEFFPAPAAWWGAALWALHPVHSEVVMCGIFRRASFATAFMLTAVLAWRRGRTGWTALCYAIGVLCKEQAAVLPGLLVAHDLWLGSAIRPALRRYAVFLGVLAGYAAVYLWLVPTPAVHRPTWPDLVDNWRTVLATFPIYARLAVWPWPLAVDHLARVSAVRVAAGAGILLAYLAATAWTFRRARLVSFGLLWIGLAHLPTAHLLPAGDAFYYLAERFLYAPLIGAAVIVAWALARDPHPRARWGAAGVAAIFAFMIMLRGSDWQSGVRLFGGNLRQYPDAYRSRYNLALSLQDERRYEDAVREYRAVIARRPDLPLAHNNLGICLKVLGRLDEAESAYATALSLAPLDARPMLNLGHLAYSRGRAKAAAGWYRRAAETVPSNPEPHRLLGKLAFEAGRLKEADHEFAEYERLGGARVGAAFRPPAVGTAPR